MARGRKEMSRQSKAVPQNPHQEQAAGQSPAPAQTCAAPTTRRTFLGQVAGAAAALAVTDVTLGTGMARARPGATPQPHGGTYAPLSGRALRQRRHAALQLRVDRARHWHALPLQNPPCQ